MDFNHLTIIFFKDIQLTTFTEIILKKLSSP